jgi:uncharacterized membrane protein YvbJ
MVYCTKCGTKNEEDAKFCTKCGASLAGSKEGREKEWDNRCEEECHGGRRGAPIFWGIIIILVGLWVIFEFALKNIPGIPSYVSEFPFWGIFALVVGLFIIIWGLRLVSRR